MADAKTKPTETKADPNPVVEDAKPANPPEGSIPKIDVKIDKSEIKPPHASTFTIKSNNRATTYASKFERAATASKLPDTPKYVNDIFQRMNFQENCQLNDGPKQTTIDVQPDYRNAFLTLVYHASKIYNDLNVKNDPYLTPSSLMAYFLSLIYGHALISETSAIRNTRSEFANDFTSVDQRRDLLQVLEMAPLPPFLEDIIKNYMPTSDPRRPGIQFVHTLAAFLFTHDYGRAYPITVFLRAHTLIATRQANAPVEETLRQWYDTPVLINANGATILAIKNLFGALLPQGTYPSSIIRAVETLFNPVTQRSQTQRPTLARLTTFPLQHAADDNLNGYIYLLGADPDNVVETTRFINNIGECLKSELKCTKTLGGSFDLQAGIGIQVHYYSPCSFPTWHTSRDPGTDAAITARTHAATVGFMQPRQIPTRRFEITYPTQPRVAEGQAAVPSLFVPAIYLRRRNAPAYDVTDDPDQVYNFNDINNPNPDVVYFNPWDYSAQICAYNVINGIHIESNNISSFAIPTVRPSRSLPNSNSQFLNSAVPASHIVPAMSITANAPACFYGVDYGNEDNQSVRLSFGNMSINRLPSFDSTLPAETLDTFQLQGFTSVNHIGAMNRCSNTFAMQHASIENNGHTPPYTAPVIYAWSSYRYINTRLRRTENRAARISFILDFRTLYGTNVTLLKSKHPFLLIPQA